MSRTPFLFVASFLTFGTVAAFYLPSPFWIVFAFASLCCLLFFLPLFQHRVTLALIFFSIGILRWELAILKDPFHVTSFVSETSTPLRLIGTVQKDETLRLLFLKKEEKWHPVSGKLKLFLSDPMPPYGEKVVVEGDFRPLRGPGNPGEFDFAFYSKGRGIDGVLKGKSSHGTEKLPSFKEKILQKIERPLPYPQGPLFGAIVAGDRTKLEGDLWDLFTRTGTVHLLSISGLHVGILVVIFYFFFKRCRLRKDIACFLTLLFLAGFSWFVGGSPPVVRASLMIGLYLFGSLLGRGASLLNILSFAYFILLVFNPFYLFEAGFQLSFLSVFFLSIANEKLTPFFKKYPKTFLGRMKRYSFQLFLLSVGVWLGIWPIVAYHFYVVSLVSWIANLFVIPLLFPIVGFGIFWLLLGQFFPLLSEGLLVVEGFLIWTLVEGTKLFDKIPFGSFYFSPPFLFLVFYYAILGTFLSGKFQRFKWKALLAGLLAWNVWIWSGLFKAPRLEVTFLDVGHGDAIFVQFPTRGTLLVDGGDQRDRFDAGQKILNPFLRKKGIRRLDAVLVTHADQDHVGGIPTVLEAFHPAYVFESCFPKENAAYQRYRHTLQKLHIEPICLSRGQRISGFPEISLEVLHPPRSFLRGTKRDENNNGIVLKLIYGETEILFTADIQEEAIRNLLETQQNLRADILKMPHHGGNLGAEAVPFLKAVSPEVAVISVGEKFGLPSQKTMAELKASNVTTYETIRSGAVQLVSDGRTFRLESFRPLISEKRRGENK